MKISPCFLCLDGQVSERTPHKGYKYLGGKCNHIISIYIPQFLVFYCSVSGVRY